MFVDTVSRQKVTLKNIVKKLTGLGLMFDILTFKTSLPNLKKLQIKTENSSPISP